MSTHFYIKSDELTKLALKLQQINDVALPFAVQNTLNRTARDVKVNSLQQTTNRLFTIRKRTFFKANSGYRTYQAKKFGYNINRLRAEVGVTKSTKSHDKATEQVGHQETAQKIKRSINPLGEKPKSKSTIDILSKKPEVYDSQSNRGEFAYIRKIERAKRKNIGIIFARGNRGTLRRVDRIQKRKPTRKTTYKYDINTTPIASYKKAGYVHLRKERPFLTDAVKLSRGEVMEKIFIEEAQKQFERVMKK